MSILFGVKIDPFEHVVDSDHIAIFENLNIHLPHPLTKFIVFMAVAALIVAAMLLWVAHKIKSGQPPRGKLWNLIESLIFFVRDKIAIPSLGKEDGDKYLPFLTTMFLFIFICNLLGLLPFLPSPTANIYVTGALAFIAFSVIHVAGLKEHGSFGAYMKSFIPHIHLEGGIFMQILGWMLKWGIAGLEYFTAFLRAGILCMRLFANIMAGHTVLFMILFFIKLVADPMYKLPIAQDWMYWPVSLMSVLMVSALNLLELFIAGLQAFIFTFLTAIFIGLAKHPPH